jgi:hypothetical protein
MASLTEREGAKFSSKGTGFSTAIGVLTLFDRITGSDRIDRMEKVFHHGVHGGHRGKIVA